MKSISRSLTRRRFLQAASAGVVGPLFQHPVLGDQLTPGRLAGLGDYVETAMSRWQVPGLAIAVVYEGNLLHARGYGVRSVGADAKVDAETIFPIASCTMSFTAAVIAKLIDNGKVKWDDPVSKHLPALELSDTEHTAKATYTANRSMASALPRPLSEFTGRYISPLYGDVLITERGGRLSLQFGTRFNGEMQYWEKESFRTFFPNPRLDDWLVTFAIQDGRVRSLRVKESPSAPSDYNDADDSGDFHRS